MVKPTPTKDMLDTFDTVPGLSSVEMVVEVLQLPDGRTAQLTTRLTTDENEFIGTDLETSMDTEKNRFVTTDGRVRLVIPLSPPKPDQSYVEA